MVVVSEFYPSHFTLPDLFEDWPFTSDPNPDKSIQEDSARWVESYPIFSPKAQDKFNRCHFGFLAASFYPNACGAHFRAGCDLMNLFFIIEALTDDKGCEEVRQRVQDVMDVLRYPESLPAEGESVLRTITRSFWKRALAVASASSAQRFLAHFDSYTASVLQEAIDHDEGRIRPFNEYLILRRSTIGVCPTIDFFSLGDHIPNEYIYHPVITSLEQHAIDMVILGNDIYSWNVEQSCGEDFHNAVTVIMKEKNLSLQEALDHVGNIYASLRTRFKQEFDQIPSLDPKYDSIIRDYCWHLGNLVSSNLKWSHYSEKYFGAEGRNILKTRRVELFRPAAKA
ncbi:hypothetical protein ONZ45_g9182 [Pleurotus djamor]|nr:hypothetical protein ONZ45_g9182 [Pleurotus djamor]